VNKWHSVWVGRSLCQTKPGRVAAAALPGRAKWRDVVFCSRSTSSDDGRPPTAGSPAGCGTRTNGAATWWVQHLRQPRWQPSSATLTPAHTSQCWLPYTHYSCQQCSNC